MIVRICFLIFLAGTIIPGITVYYKGNQSARFFLLAWTAFIGASILLTLRFEGILPDNYLSVYSLPLGFSIEAVLLSLALADRINIMKREVESYSTALEVKVREHKEMEEKYRSLIYEASDAIILVDKEGRVLEANRSAEGMTGMSRADLVKLEFGDLFHEESMGGRFDELVQQKRWNVNNGTLKRGDMGEVVIDGSFTVIEFSGTEVVQCIMRDITKRRREEEERIKAQRLESVGVLAGGIAHDFNNMLMGVANNINLALLEGEAGGKVKEILNRAESAVYRAKGLALQLLTFSKGGEPLKRPVMLGRLIRETISFALRGGTIREETEIGERLWAVEADEGQIGQALSNMVINARQAMEKGGTLKVRAENAEIGEESELPLKKGKYVKVSVEDNGEGIEEENLGKIFDPYFSTREGGSGLGLTTGFSIIKKHDGYVGVSSVKGIGTTFEIYLPASDRACDEEEQEETLIKGEGRILLMEDDEAIRESLAEELRLTGYEVEVVKEGRSAIEMYKNGVKTNRKFSAVILDLTIRGGMGGIEIMKRLKETDSEAKGIAISGYSNAGVLAGHKEYGFTAALGKPFKIETLSRVLHRVTG